MRTLKHFGIFGRVLEPPKQYDSCLVTPRHYRKSQFFKQTYYVWKLKFWIASLFLESVSHTSWMFWICCWNFEILKILNFETLELWSFETLKFRICEIWNFELFQNWHLGNLQYWNSVFLFWNFETSKLWSFC